jgi:hypothetical protein
MGDFIIVLVVKLLIVFGGNYLLVLWLRKNPTTLIVVVCWFLGLFLNFYQPFTIYVGIFQNFFADENSFLANSRSLDSLAVLLSIITFFVVGIKFYKKNKS